MRLTRRSLLTLSVLATSSLATRGPFAFATEPSKPSDKPLRILILGGTGFTGPYQVRYALARGHRVTLFNRGKQPIRGRRRSKN